MSQKTLMINFFQKFLAIFFLISRNFLCTLSIFFYSFFLSSNCKGMRINQIKEEVEISTAKKILLFICSPCANCNENKLVKKSQPYHKINNKLAKEKFAILILTIPDQILFEIAYYLNPPEIYKLSLVSHRFSVLHKNIFWEGYNKLNMYVSWDSSISLMKIAFANFWLKHNKFYKSAKVGHPYALEIERYRNRNVSDVIYDQFHYNYQKLNELEYY